MKPILLISNNQTLRELLERECGVEIVNFSEVFNEEQTANTRLIITDSITAEQKRKIKAFLDKHTDAIHLTELDDTAFEAFKKYPQYAFFQKPIKFRLLLKKIKELLKDDVQELLVLRHCNIDLKRRLLSLKDQAEVTVKLTELEIALIACLYNAKNALTKEELLKQVWGYKNIDQMEETGLVESAIFKLEKKMSEYDLEPLIENIGNKQFRLLQ